MAGLPPRLKLLRLAMGKIGKNVHQGKTENKFNEIELIDECNGFEFNKI